MRRYFLFLLLLPSIVFAQPGQGTRATIMVVPWTSSEENVLQKLDNDFDYRAVLSEIKKAFDVVGFTTIDFVQKLKNIPLNEIGGMNNWRTLYKDVIDNSQADIIIEAEIFIRGSKYGNKVQMKLEAKETSSSESLVNSGLIESEPFNTADYAHLAQGALLKNKIMDNFLSLMDNKFDRIRKIGRVTVIRIEVGENSDFNLQATTKDGDFITELIQDWVDATTRSWVTQGLVEDVGYNIAGNTASLLEFDQFRIPFADETGRRYDLSRFARDFRKAIAQFGLTTGKGAPLVLKQDIRRNVLILSVQE